MLLIENTSSTLIVLFVFSGLALAGYYLLPRRLRTIWLLFASYGIYVLWAGAYALVLPVYSLAIYGLGRWIDRAEKGRGAISWLGIGISVAALAFFRYPQRMLTPLFDGAGNVAARIMFPVGFSYTVMSGIAYLVDVRHGRTAASRKLEDFALFLAYFPKLLAGPIERAQVLIPKLIEPQPVDREAVARNLLRILVGLFRKLVIADMLVTIIPTWVFARPGEYSAPELALWLVAYAFYLYNDFAGYSRIVRGISGLFGIELTQNFDAPYFSNNFSTFWNRWHISLSHWLRDYIFFPSSRILRKFFPNRNHLANVFVPPMLTMLVSALWHELSLTMLLWGGLHGLFMGIERLFSLWGRRVPVDKQPWWRRAGSTLLVFVLVVLVWVPFRTYGDETIAYWLGLLNFKTWADLLIGSNWAIIGGTMAVVMLSIGLDVIQFRGGEPVIMGWRPLPRTVLIVVMIIVLLISIDAGWLTPPFVYQGI
jgi:alginate O-acetyltransferase complex protein AlgI